MVVEKGEPSLTLIDAPDEQAQVVIRGGLSEYNLGQAGYSDARPLAVLVSDPESRETIGGLLGKTSMGLLFIDLFFLPDSWRGHGVGTRVIRAAEDEALRRGCTRAVLFYGYISSSRFLRERRISGARPHRVRSTGAHADLYDEKTRQCDIGR